MPAGHSVCWALVRAWHSVCAWHSGTWHSGAWHSGARALGRWALSRCTILPEWDVSEVEKSIQSFFGDKEVFVKDEQIDNFDDEANSEVQAGEQYLELKDVIETKITTNTP